MPRASYPFVDWMKAVGMSLIVYGHVAHATTVPLTPPIYLKQFGVAFSCLPPVSPSCASDEAS